MVGRGVVFPSNSDKPMSGFTTGVAWRSGYYMMAQWTMMINHGVIPTAWDNVQSVQAFPNPVCRTWGCQGIFSISNLSHWKITAAKILRSVPRLRRSWVRLDRREDPSRLRTLENTHVKCFLEVGKQGLVTVPFWEYWTSPYSSHYRPYT